MRLNDESLVSKWLCTNWPYRFPRTCTFEVEFFSSGSTGEREPYVDRRGEWITLRVPRSQDGGWVIEKSREAFETRGGLTFPFAIPIFRHRLICYRHDKAEMPKVPIVLTDYWDEGARMPAVPVIWWEQGCGYLVNRVNGWMIHGKLTRRKPTKAIRTVMTLMK